MKNYLSKECFDTTNQLFRKMKTTCLMFLVFASSLFATNVNSQVAKVSITVKNANIIKVIEAIESQTDYFFVYNKNEIDLNREVTLEVKNQPVAEVLSGIFSNTNVVYAMEGTNIMLMQKSDSQQQQRDSQQQQKPVSGKVTDSTGAPLPGVTVVIKGTTSGTITDSNGNYSLSNIPANATLQFSFVGMKMQEIVVGGKTAINVALAEETVGLEEVVAVGYGTQKKGLLTGSVSTVESGKLVQAPFTSVSNAVRGQLPGVVSVQSSGQPGFDKADLSIRGFGAPLVVVDGVEADFNSIDPTQIEAVTILKDGAASIYGSRAGNGVILITTKRGNIQKPTFSFSTSLTEQGITYMPKKASSGQITEMSRETHLQSGMPEATAPYTAEEVKKYYDGTDPQYPNTDWYHLAIRDWAPQQQHNLSVRGGSEAIKYFGYLGYNKQESIWKPGKGGNYQRFNFQSNIDANILENLSLQIDVAATWENVVNTARSQSAGTELWQDYWNTQPMYPATLPDPTKNSFAGIPGVGNVMLSTNTDISGYNRNNNNILKGTMSLNYKFKWIDGLSAKAFVNLVQTNNHTKSLTKSYDFYRYDYKSDTYTFAGGISNSGIGEGLYENKVITGQVYLKYENVISKVHRVSAMAISEMIDYKSNYFNAARTNLLSNDLDYLFAGSTVGMSNNGAATEMGRISYIGRFNYSFKDKYLFESTIRADASAKFPKERRWGYFPSISLGWKVSEEGFIKENIRSIDNLKLRASYGQSGRDAVGNFQYLTGFQLNPRSYILGTGSQADIISMGLANPNLTWEHNTIYNAGVDFSLFNKKLYGAADVFYRLRSGIPATRLTSLPSSFGANLPPENLNSLNDRGFEVLIGTYGKKGDLTWDISANLSWSRAKWDHYEEPEYTDPDQKRQNKLSGQWTDRYFGYLSDGLFTSQQEINDLPFDIDRQGNKTLRPGDMRYIDVNKDGILDWKDMVEIGNGTLPHWNVGFNTNLRYKNFDLSFLLQGALGNYHQVTFTKMLLPPVYYYTQRWTQENNDPNAFIPRLGGSPTNNYPSDHWYKRADYLRLKVISLGYNLPSQWLNRINLKQLRIYIAGTNLLTYNPLKKYAVDPEAPSGADGWNYPQQRTITIGLDMSF